MRDIRIAVNMRICVFIIIMPVIILYYNVFNPVLILIIFATIVILTIGLLIILTIVNINPMISSTM